MSRGEIKNRREVQKLLTIAEYAQKNAAKSGDTKASEIAGIVGTLNWILGNEDSLETILGKVDHVYDPEMTLEHNDLI